MSNNEFEGFVQPVRNFYHMPNNWTDITAEIDNLAELKVVEYVMRHTWGFREFNIKKTISADEFMHGRRRADGSRMDKGTGLSNHSVIDGLKSAIQHGYLICEVDTSDLARVKKSYALKISAPGEDVAPPEDVAPGEEDTASYEDTSPRGATSSPRGAESADRSEKDTVERHCRKTPKKERSGANAPTSHAPSEEMEKPSPLVAPKTRLKPARVRVVKEVKPKPDIFASASPEIQAIATEWRTIFKTALPVTAKLLEHATTLSAYQPVPGEIAACRLWMYQNDKNKWYSQKGMHLGDVAREFERFRSLASMPEPDQNSNFVNGKPRTRLSSWSDPTYTKEKFEAEFYPVKPIITKEASYAESF